jgi:hypothetical protein
MGDQRKSNGFIVFLIFLIIVVLIWGFVGGKQAQKNGITCDFGLGKDNTFCWKWHTNALGQAQEFIDDTADSVNDLFNDK